MESLYRPEALAAAHEPARCVPLHARQPGWRMLLALLLPALVLGSLFLSFASFDERIRSEGMLVPAGGMVALPAPSAGTVLRVHRQQGDLVASGSTLFELSPEAIDGNAAANREQRRRLLRAELEAAGQAAELEHTGFLQRRKSLLQRIDSLLADQLSMRQQSELDRARVDLSVAKLERLQPLADRGLLSALQISDQQSALLAQRAELQTQARLRSALARDLQAAQAELERLPADMELAASSHRVKLESLAQRAAELERERASEVRAPTDGVLVSVLPQEGAWVVAGQPLAAMAPADAVLQAQVLVPSTAPARPRIGQDAVVRLLALPHQRHGHLQGRVVAISGAPLTPEQLAQTGLGWQVTQPMYQVLLELDFAPESPLGRKLQPGMRLQADLLVSKRSLLDGLLQPLRSAAAGTDPES